MKQPEDRPPDAGTAKSPLRCRAHGAFAEWLANSGGSLAITTYTSGKLVLVRSDQGRLRFRSLRFARPMGLAAKGRYLALATREQLLLFRGSRVHESDENQKTVPASPSNVFSLHREFQTGRLNAHDVAFGRRGVYFVNTRYNCLARPAEHCSFLCNWKPPFLREVVSKDCCHLNGLGMQDGRPAMATAFCETDHPGGWREQDQLTTGVLVDIQANRVVVRGLCMPHSPRYHCGQWWFCNSGHGTLCTFDASANQHQEICSLGGFTRGMCLVDDRVLVGLSKIRHEHVLDSPSMRQRISRGCSGVALVDLTTHREIGLLEFTSGGNEVYEIVFLPQIRHPQLVGLDAQKGP